MNELKTKIVVPFSKTWIDYPDDESLAVVIYFLGCIHNCIGCHNPLFKLTDYKSAQEFTPKQLYDELFKFCDAHQTKKVIFSGGDSLNDANVAFTKYFVNSYGNIFDICIYTGYTIEEVKYKNIKGFKYIKVGQYVEELKQESYKSDHCLQLASSNQEIYNANYNLVSRKGKMNF